MHIRLNRYPNKVELIYTDAHRPNGLDHLKEQSPMYARFILVTVALILSGCTANQYDNSKPLDPTQAVIVGRIAEGFLTQPHGLQIDIQRQGEPATHIQLRTLGNNKDVHGRFVLGEHFMYQVPPGTYEVTGWQYQYYAGKSMARRAADHFTVKAGEVAYIGNYTANSLSYCLTRNSQLETAVETLVKKFPILKDRPINNVAESAPFAPWPTSDARDNGKGLCNF